MSGVPFMSRYGLVVENNGAQITGNSTITGNLAVTGSLIAVALSIASLVVSGAANIGGTITGNSGIVITAGGAAITGAVGIVGAVGVTGAVTASTDLIAGANVAAAGNVRAAGEVNANNPITGGNIVRMRYLNATPLYEIGANNTRNGTGSGIIYLYGIDCTVSSVAHANDLVMIGQGHNVVGPPGAGTPSVIIGRGVTQTNTQNSNLLIIGNGLALGNPICNNVVVISNGGVFDGTDIRESVVVGRPDFCGRDCVIVGRQARGNSGCTAIGRTAQATTTDAVVVGFGASATATRGVAIGRTALCSHTDSIALGPNSTTTAANQCRIGGSTVINLAVTGTIATASTTASTSTTTGALVTAGGLGVAGRASIAFLHGNLYNGVVTQVFTDGVLTRNVRFVTQLGAGRNTTLWASPQSGDMVTIKNVNLGPTTVTGGSATIDGVASIALAAGESANVFYDGAIWRRI